MKINGKYIANGIVILVTILLGWYGYHVISTGVINNILHDIEGKGLFFELFNLIVDNLIDTRTLIHRNWWIVVLGVLAALAIVFFYFELIFGHFRDMIETFEESGGLWTEWIIFYFLLAGAAAGILRKEPYWMLNCYLFSGGVLWIFFGCFIRVKHWGIAVLRFLAILLLSVFGYALGAVLVYVMIIILLMGFMKAVASIGSSGVSLFSSSGSSDSGSSSKCNHYYSAARRCDASAMCPHSGGSCPHGGNGWGSCSHYSN